MVEVAVEPNGRALGRCRLQMIPDAAGPTPREFIVAHAEPGSVVISDGLAATGRRATSTLSIGLSPSAPSDSSKPAPAARAATVFPAPHSPETARIACSQMHHWIRATACPCASWACNIPGARSFPNGILENP